MVPETPPVVRDITVDGLALALRSDAVTLIASDGTVLDDAQLVGQAAAVDVVYVGEEHDQQSHHDLQAAVIAGLAETRNVSVALEMVTRSRQPILDQYSAGQINERRLWNSLEWESTWGMPRELYRGVITSAETPNVRLLGVNIDRYLTRRVFEVGIDELGAHERQQLPVEYDFSNEAYADYLEGVLAEHMDTESPDFSGLTQRFIQAQLTWDEFMAESIARDINAGGDGVWVAVVGSGHVQNRWGIPGRVTRRVEGVTDLTIVCSTVPADATDDELAATIQERLSAPDADILCISLRPLE